MFYQLPIFIIVNNQFLNPAVNLETYNYLLQKFNSILYLNPNQYFQGLSVYAQRFYRTAMAFKFYFNELISELSVNTVGNYIKQSFELTNQGRFNEFF